MCATCAHACSIVGPFLAPATEKTTVTIFEELLGDGVPFHGSSSVVPFCFNFQPIRILPMHNALLAFWRSAHKWVSTTSALAEFPQSLSLHNQRAMQTETNMGP